MGIIKITFSRLLWRSESKDNLGTVCAVSRSARFTACIFHRPAELRFGCRALGDTRQWGLLWSWAQNGNTETV